MTWIQEAKIIDPSGQTGDGGNGETGDDASATVVLIAICVAIFLLGGAALFVYVYCKGDATCYTHPLTKGMFFNDGRDENSEIEESFTELPIEK